MPFTWVAQQNAITMERDYMSVCSSAASMPSNTSVTPNMRTSSGSAPLAPNPTGPLQSGPPLHHPISAVQCLASRILSRNANGTSKSMTAYAELCRAVPFNALLPLLCSLLPHHSIPFHTRSQSKARPLLSASKSASLQWSQLITTEHIHCWPTKQP